MANFLITGGMGFIGHHLVSKLEDDGHEVTIIDTCTNYGKIPAWEMRGLLDQRVRQISSVCYPYSITDGTRLENVFKTGEIDIVIHLASTPNKQIVDLNPKQASQTMIHGVINLCRLAKDYDVKRFVYISSSMVYGDFEDGIKEDVPCNPTDIYGILKLTGEQLVKQNRLMGGPEYTIIRPSAVYGPRDTRNRVLTKFLINAMRNEIIQVYGEDQKLDFTHVDDLVNGIIAATGSSNAIDKCYNLTKGQARTLLEAAEIAVNLVGKGDIEALGRDMSYPSRGTLSIDAAINDFGYDPKITLEHGMKELYDYFNEHTVFWTRSPV